MEKTKVRVVSSSIVVPANELERRTIVLSPLDHLMGYSAYQKRALFYREAEENASTVLKESLAKALVHFYPFAGRLSLKNSIKLELDCNNAGITFLEASTDATLEDLGEFLPSEFCDSLCQMEIFPEWPWRADYPLLTVQVTRFSCGGLSVGVCFSHQICDGPSFWHFMNSWSEIVRTGSLLIAPEISYTIPVEATCDKDERQELMKRHAYGLIPREQILRLVRSTGWKGLSGLSLKLMRFDRNKLAKLKSMAPGFSTYVVLCAYFWRRLAKTWGKPDTETTTLYVLVNCRGKLRRMHKSYFGNGILPTPATSTVGELSSNSLAFAANLLHAAITSFTEETIEAILSFMYENQDDPEYIPMIDSKTGSNLLIVSSPRHPVYETDFGWGRPAGTSFGANDLGHNKVYLFPNAEDSGTIDVTFALNTESMNTFEQEKEDF